MYDSLKKWPKPIPPSFSSLLRLPSFGNDLLRIWRIHRHLRFIDGDDKLLIKDKLQESLDDHDLAQALSERGLYVPLSFCAHSIMLSCFDSIMQGLPLKARQARLRWWLDSVKDVSEDSAVARRLYLLTQRNH